MASEFEALVPYFVNFSLVVMVLVFAGRKPLRKFIYQRHERMRDLVESAAIAHKNASARERVAREALVGVLKEEAGLLLRESELAEQERREILEKAGVEVKRINGETERLVGVEQDEAVERVRERFLALVVQEAEDGLRKGLKRDDHSAILKRAQNSIEVGV